MVYGVAIELTLITLLCILGDAGTLGHIHNLDNTYITTVALTLWAIALKLLTSPTRQQYYS